MDICNGKGEVWFGGHPAELNLFAASPRAGPLQATGTSEQCHEALVWEVLPGVSPRGFLSSRGESTGEGESQLRVLCCSPRS